MLAGRAGWTKRIRPDAIANAENSCELCGVKGGRLICHDKWSYNDKKTTANLVGFEIHCGDCDLVTHFKRMMQVADPETVLKTAIMHLCNVNGCKVPDAVAILTDADQLWAKRNKKKWKVAVAPALLKTYPELEGLANFKPSVAF
jgi:hypothetical protein